MTLIIPPYIEAANIRGTPVAHKWGSDSYFIRESDRLLDSVSEISYRGVLALSAGISEWIVWRFDGLSDYHKGPQFVEAVWAGIADPRYVVRWKASKEDKPSGPTNGPLYVSNWLLSKVFVYASVASDGVDTYSIYLAFLARHVLPKKKPFEDWLRLSLVRLAELYPRAAEADESEDDEDDDEEEDAAPGIEEIGPPVPRAALDPALDFDPKMTARLLRAYLKSLDPAKNPYLQSPKEMVKLGFDGTPYAV